MNKWRMLDSSDAKKFWEKRKGTGYRVELNCIRIQGQIFIFGYLKAKGNGAYRIFLSEKHSSLSKDTPILPPPSLFVLLLPTVLQVFYPQLLIHFHLPLFFFFYILPIFIIFLPNGIRKNPSLSPPLFLISSYGTV